MHRAWIAAAAVVLAGCSIGADVPAAKAVVEKFHRQVNAGQFADIYRQSAPDMKRAASEVELVGLLTAIQRRLGKFVSAPEPGWNDQRNTSGHFITLTYRSKYERGEAEESFVLRIDDGKARLVRYDIQSQAMIAS